MGTVLRLLIIEDVEDHALLIVRELQKGGLDIDFTRVETVQELAAALDTGPWDAIISDFGLPGFDGIDALRMVQEKRLDVPFLLVSGAIGEEKAAEVMKAGAHDYIKKGNYARLVPTLERELRDARIRQERRQTALELTRHRERLEELVQERTAQLVTANESLQKEVSERESAERALSVANAKLQLITDTMSIGVYQGSPDRRYAWVSAALAKWLERPVEEITGRPIVEVIGSEGYQAIEPYIERVLAGETAEYEIETTIAGVGVRWINGKYTPLYGAAGAQEGWVAVISDMTERKKLEKQVENLNADLAGRVAELEERNQELDAFNRTVSHDLRHPLNLIALSCQEMALLCPEEQTSCQGPLRVIHQGVKRMNAMIETLLKFSRSTHADLRREWLDLSGMAGAVAAELHRAEPKRPVRFLIAEGVTAYGDASLLRAVMENLMGNAWKYTGNREEAVIEFGAVEIGGERAFFLRDNGKGFDMSKADRLFLPFQRLHDAEEFKGSGIGLATVERIVRRHGGRAWAEGEPDKGATFYFTLGGPP